MTEARISGSLRILVDVVASGDVVILSGAGLSTESGIPDYRGPTGLARRATPMTYQTFTGSAAARRRYWARSYLGWRHIARAVPNDGHLAVAELSRRGLLTGIITQNVDGLHQAAGASEVTELHGSLHRVICLSCGQRTSRAELDRRLESANPGWDTEAAASVNPDGDAAVDDEAIASFRVADCVACQGALKPDVVFFGENVPRPRAQACYDLVESADALVVLGSSLTVMSGFRYVRHAAKCGDASRDRQPGSHPRRPVRDRDPRRPARPDPQRPRGPPRDAAMTGAPQDFDVVTGAFSYSGAAIASALQAAGRRVRTLTGHPGRAPADTAIEARPLDFTDPAGLAESMRGARTLYNTYWVRFAHGTVSHPTAVAHSRILFAAAAEAGVQRIVHVSITHPTRTRLTRTSAVRPRSSWP